jgi:hypothetical protein
MTRERQEREHDQRRGPGNDGNAGFLQSQQHEIRVQRIMASSYPVGRSLCVPKTFQENFKADETHYRRNAR